MLLWRRTVEDAKTTSSCSDEGIIFTHTYYTYTHTHITHKHTDIYIYTNTHIHMKIFSRIRRFPLLYLWYLSLTLNGKYKTTKYTWYAQNMIYVTWLCTTCCYDQYICSHVHCICVCWIGSLAALDWISLMCRVTRQQTDEWGFHRFVSLISSSSSRLFRWYRHHRHCNWLDQGQVTTLQSKEDWDTPLVRFPDWLESAKWVGEQDSSNIESS